LRHLIIALAVLAVPGAGLAQDDTAPALPTRQTEIHNHTDLTISRLSLRRLAIAPDANLYESVTAEAALQEATTAPDDAAGWEDVLDENGAQQVLETHTHLNVSWAATECWAGFKAELSDGSVEYSSVDACNDTQLQFGTQFDHE
jgi:hypothetical protein